MIETLYQLITHPFNFIEARAHETHTKLSWLCIVLASLCIASEANGNVVSLVSLTMMTIMIYSALLFAQSVTIDFFAQGALGREAKSLRLFYWFGISLLPLALWVPLDILYASGKGQSLISLIKFSLFILILAQQIAILKAQYTLSTRKSLLLYIFPFLFTGLSFIGLVLILVFLG